MAVDSRGVKDGTAALNDLTAAGSRAEASAAGIGIGMRGAAAEAAAMASAAQLSARAAVDQAAGFGTATRAAQLNTMALRESLVVARELSRGNFTRIPGSLTLLAQGVGSQGGIGAFASAIAQQLGLIRQVQDAELAAAAASAAASARSIAARAAQAGENIIAADTELALAEAQLRVAESSSAAAAAEAAIAGAHEAAAAAANEARIAEEALARARGLEVEASNASAASTRTVIGGAGVGLLGLAAVAGTAYAAFKQFQDQVKDSGQLDDYAEKLNLTDEQVKKLGGSIKYLGDGTREISGLTVSFGDVMRGVWEEVANEAGNSGTWDTAKSAASSAFSSILEGWNVATAGLSAGLYMFEDIGKVIFNNFAAIVGNAFVSAVNLSIEAINALARAGAAAINGIGHAVGVASNINAPQIGQVANPYAGRAGAALSQTFNLSDYYQRELAHNNSAFAGVVRGAVSSARNRYKSLSDSNRPKKTKTKKPKRNEADDEIAKLSQQITSQNALAQAYLAGDAAALKAEADEKALALALDKHATAAQTVVLKHKELALAIANATLAGAKEIDNLNADATVRQKVNAMVAAGLVPASQANQAIQDELALRQQLAALANAQDDLADARHAKDQKRVADDIKAIQSLQAVISRMPVAQAADEAAKAVTDAAAQIASNDNEIAQLEKKNSLIGQSNSEIAVQLALLQEQQQLVGSKATPDQQNTLLSQAAQKAALSVQSPWQQWAATVPKTANAVNDALDTIAFKGFDDIASAIGQVVTGTESLGQAFKQVAQSIIADIVQMTVKMLIFKALTSVFGGGFSLGGDLPIDTGAAGIANSAVLPSLSGFRAGGGPVTGGQTYMVGEKGPELFRPSQSGTIIPNGAANSNEPQVVINMNGVITNDQFWDEVDKRGLRTAAGVVQLTAPGIIKSATMATMKAVTRPKISGGR